jgi:archaemetzincin
MSPIGRRRFLAMAVLAKATFVRPATAESPPPGDKRRIYVQPIGASFEDEELAFIESALLAFYDVSLERLAQVSLPRSAFYPPRQRYRAERLLDFLAPKLPPGGHRILGLTSVDISTTKGSYPDWGVMGLATLDGAACVLSSFRCRRGATNADHALVRFAKTAVHELGHTFGLPHCPTRGCLMEDGKGSVFTTDHEYDLCATSRASLVASGYSLSQKREIPWPKPEESRGP